MNPDELTRQNETLVQQWFELSGFEATKLDIDNSSKNADWLFTKSDVAVICEVKTVFSGGIGHGKEGREDSPGTYRHFIAELKKQLQTDPEIGSLPFHVTVGIDALYVPNKEQFEAFKAWIKHYILSAQHAQEQLYFDDAFPFRESGRNKDGSRIRSIEGRVHFVGPVTRSGLIVQELAGGTPPNYEKFENTIRGAIVGQIRSSLTQHHLQNPLVTLAVWSASNHLPLFRWLLDMFLDKQERYNLLDWAFKEFPELSAIMLFEQVGTNSICLLITSPFLPTHATQLKQLITNSPVRFIGGIIEPNGPNS